MMSHDRFAFRVGCLLRWANSDPSATRDRQGFYRLKQAICERYGTLVGHDIQRIVHECWECNGTGFVKDWDGNDEYCHRCSCGVWQVVYVRLERWDVGGKIFHRPVGRVIANETLATISGKIAHKPSCMSLVSAIALAKLFSSSLYWKWLEMSEPIQFGRRVVRSSRLAEMVGKDSFYGFRLEFSHTLHELELPAVEERW